MAHSFRRAGLLASLVLPTLACAKPQAKTVDAPVYPSSLHATIDTQHCKLTKHQPDPESGMTSLLCVTDEQSAVGVLMSQNDWNTLLWSPGAIVIPPNPIK